MNTSENTAELTYSRSFIKKTILVTMVIVPLPVDRRRD